MNRATIFFLIIFAVLNIIAANSFETISDDDLVERIKTNEYFIVLFCKCSYMAEKKVIAFFIFYVYNFFVI